MALNPGDQVERYVVERLLGRGAMAEVYQVRHRTLKTTHALKVLMLASHKIRDRLIQEGQVQAQIRHPNVLSVTDVLDVAGAPGLLMELVEGPSLEEYVEERHPPQAECLKLFRGVLAGVAEAHGIGLVHRDLKPANVLVASTPRGPVPKVADFGLAKVLSEEEGAAMGRTRSGSALGTPAYMAPEQIRDAKYVDHRADLFSLGCILYELMEGRRPFDGEDLLTVFNAVASGQYAPVDHLPAPIRLAITGCLEVERNARIPDCETLEQVLDGERTGWEDVSRKYVSRGGNVGKRAPGGEMHPPEPIASPRAAAAGTFVDAGDSVGADDVAALAAMSVAESASQGASVGIAPAVAGPARPTLVAATGAPPGEAAAAPSGRSVVDSAQSLEGTLLARGTIAPDPREAARTIEAAAVGGLGGQPESSAPAGRSRLGASAPARFPPANPRDSTEPPSASGSWWRATPWFVAAAAVGLLALALAAGVIWQLRNAAPSTVDPNANPNGGVAGEEDRPDDGPLASGELGGGATGPTAAPTPPGGGTSGAGPVGGGTAIAPQPGPTPATPPVVTPQPPTLKKPQVAPNPTPRPTPDAKPLPVVAPPAPVVTPATARLRVSCEQGAEVFVDGKNIGRTPAHAEVGLGRHDVLFRGPAGAEKHLSATVTDKGGFACWDFDVGAECN